MKISWGLNSANECTLQCSISPGWNQLFLNKEEMAEGGCNGSVQIYQKKAFGLWLLLSGTKKIIYNPCVSIIALTENPSKQQLTQEYNVAFLQGDYWIITAFQGDRRQCYSYLCQPPVITLLLSHLPACLAATGIATFPYPAVTVCDPQQAPSPSLSVTVWEVLKKTAG